LLSTSIFVKPSARVAHDADEIAVERRFAAGELQGHRSAFRAEQRLQRAPHLFAAQLDAFGSGVGQAHVAGQVAALRDLDDREAGVLVVRGAQPAVVRAALGLGHGHAGRPLDEARPAAHPFVARDVGRDDALEVAVLRAGLAHDDSTVAGRHLAGDGAQALRAHAEHVVAEAQATAEAETNRRSGRGRRRHGLRARGGASGSFIRARP
jgi:hypothetical protein